MGTYALELNDADIVAWDVGAERLRDSGHALVGEPPWLFGAAAAASARLRPHLSLTTHWSEIDAGQVAGLPFAAAEVAYRQMLTWAESLRADAGVWLVSPAATHGQLGVLLGVAQAAQLPVAVLADRAAAAVSALPVQGTVFCVDVELERGIVSEVQVHEGRVARHRVAVLPELGQRPLHVALAKGFAARMVQQLRFDPLHDATTEQALFDALPGWLTTLAHGGGIAEAAVASGASRYAIEYRAAHAAADLGAAFRLLTAKLHGLRRAQSAAAILLTATAARLPGLMDALQEFADCPVFSAPSGQAAQAALGLAAAPGTQESPSLLLTLAHHPYEAWLPVRAAVAPDAGTAATHVVYGGRALALSTQPLLVGTAEAPRGVLIPASVAGVSRRHCSLMLDGGQAFVVDHSRFGSFVNDERIHSRALLRVGDRLRLGNPGVELSFVRME